MAELDYLSSLLAPPTGRDNALTRAMVRLALQDMAPLLGILAEASAGYRSRPDTWGLGDTAAHFANSLSQVFCEWRRLDPWVAGRARGSLAPGPARLLDAAQEFVGTWALMRLPGPAFAKLRRDHEEAAALLGAVIPSPPRGAGGVAAAPRPAGARCRTSSGACWPPPRRR